jgi:hypothetical protein
MTTNPPLQKILQGILQTEDESKQTMRRWAVSSHRRRKDKESENNIDSAIHNQIIKQQKQLNGKNHHIPIFITLNVHQLIPLSKHLLANCIKRKIQQSFVYRRPISLTEKNTGLGEKVEEDLPSQWPPKVDRSSNTYLRQSRLQPHFDQMR